MLAEVILWIYDRSPEIIATITGLLYIVYSVERNIFLWPYGIISSAIFVYVFYVAGIYADMGLYIYYVVIGFYGWYHWGKSNKKGEGSNSLHVKKTSLKLFVNLTLFTVACYFIILFLLRRYTDSTIPYWDSFTTALSITATWMLTQKYLEHWILWIVVDSVSIALYFYKGLYPSIILFVVYTILSITGYTEWKKEWKTTTAT
ncbi:MAG: nicotinamide mononucleotide transporter [Bacteroidales bacterium]|nr:nicotinamide mononucleotide transporter [Bacteroidales bacterium]